jgi:multiple sugar transport system ATP-binding protein
VAEIELVGVGKVYPGKVRALRDLNIDIAEGEFLVFVGPSGCGKTTALRLVAGLEKCEEGEIRIGGEVVNDVEPRRRNLAMVFQNYALYPHMKVYDNLAFPLRSARFKRDEIDRRVRSAAQLLELDGVLDRKPRALSGGQRQRVAMGRAIVRHPDAFLMDEPLSNLDAKLRMQMRADVVRLQRELGVTTIYVTHDQVEAMTMGSRIAVMRDGVLQQIGRPEEVYAEPANMHVAGFVGSPGMNLMQGHLHRVDDALMCRLGEQDVEVPRERTAELARHENSPVVVGIRPEALQQPNGGPPPGGELRGEVTGVEMLGHERLLMLDIDAPVAAPVATDTDAGDGSDDKVAPDGPGRLRARLPGLTGADVGGTAQLWFDPGALHFFDPVTGVSLGRGARRA